MIVEYFKYGSKRSFDRCVSIASIPIVAFELSLQKSLNDTSVFIGCDPRATVMPNLPTTAYSFHKKTFCICKSVTK